MQKPAQVENAASPTEVARREPSNFSVLSPAVVAPTTPIELASRDIPVTAVVDDRNVEADLQEVIERSASTAVSPPPSFGSAHSGAAAHQSYYMSSPPPSGAFQQAEGITPGKPGGTNVDATLEEIFCKSKAPIHCS